MHRAATEGIPTYHEHLAVRQDGQSRTGPLLDHRAGGREAVGGRVVELRLACAHQQDLAVGQKRRRVVAAATRERHRGEMAGLGSGRLLGRRLRRGRRRGRGRGRLGGRLGRRFCGRGRRLPCGDSGLRARGRGGRSGRGRVGGRNAGTRASRKRRAENERHDVPGSAAEGWKAHVQAKHLCLPGLSRCEVPRLSRSASSPSAGRRTRRFRPVFAGRRPTRSRLRTL